jgi:hypothetical protein
MHQCTVWSDFTILAFPLYALPLFLFSIFKHDLRRDEQATTREDHKADTWVKG